MKVADQQIKIKKIFEENWENFWAIYQSRYPVSQHQSIEESVRKMLDCGDISKGYYHYRCTSCGKGETKVGFSCKSRFCARCGKLYTDDWLEKTSEKIANVEHRHLVFTIPKEFRALVYWNRELLKELATLVVKTIEVEFGRNQSQAGREEQLIGGIILVIHTFGRDMKFNPHFHVLLANVAIEKKSGKKRKLAFLLYRTLHKVWEYKFLQLMGKRFGGDVQIRDLISKCWKNNPDGFYVNVQKPMKDADHAIFYIGRYLGRPAIAEYRIVEYDGKQVTFWYEDHESQRREYVTLPVHKFMARLVQHIPLKNFPMVRRYGFYARHLGEKIKEVLSGLKKEYKEFLPLPEKK